MYFFKIMFFDIVGDYENYIRRLELYFIQVNVNEGFFFVVDGIYLLMKQGVNMCMDQIFRYF